MYHLWPWLKNECTQGLTEIWEFMIFHSCKVPGFSCGLFFVCLFVCLFVLSGGGWLGLLMAVMVTLTGSLWNSLECPCSR